MILRTPLPKRRREAAAGAEDANKPIIESPPTAGGSDRRLVIYEDPSSVGPESSHQPSEHMLCTYQCRQMVKADFFDALSNAEKQACEYKSKWEELNENFCKTEAERKKFRDQFLYAEQELAAAKGREKVLQEQLLKEVDDSQARLRKQIQLSSELQVKHQNELNLRLKAEAAAASAKEKASLLEGKLSHLSDTIEREKKHLNNDLTQLKRESKFSISRISADLERMECRAKNAEKESEILQQQMEDLKKQLNECMHQKSDVEKKLSSFSLQEVPNADNNILVKHLQEEIRNYETEVREARRLKSSYENIELLKEKLLQEKDRRERVEKELSKLQEVQQSMYKLEDELSSWKMLIKDIPGLSCSEDIPVKFAALQKEVLDNMMKLGEANAQLKQMEVALDAAQLGKQNAETEAALAKEKAEVSESEVKRIESMLSMVTEERDKLRNVVDELKRLKNDDGADELANRTIVQELESSLAKKEHFIEELERNLREEQEINNRQRDEIKLLNERLINEARRLKSLERENDRLRSEISLLESKLGHGDFSSTSTKVLRMVNTLAVDNEAKQTIEALQAELQKTKEKLQAVEELKSQSGDAGKLVDSFISGKILQLKEQIATLEKREERYKTVFADRISVFRRACCELFGYKILMDEHQRSNGIPVTHFTLQSIYAQGDDEKLEFEYESGNTNILVNDYASQPEISRQVDIFVRKMNSIPAFTANLTVESFNRRTLS
ncbi:mitotic spindle checkpoint protein MAD1 [Melia azedarach]|uniref:Mitotic spindle checkpoint protein MAD1 n=1 Tax=Melia azedarach TaxID=155640 RepID=A0ACC1Y1N9_MELAZ|nr:mitotic spindle checkpoint protein MAD1 [Melia azedarach]